MKGLETILIIGGLAAAAVLLYTTQKCELLYPIFKADCNAGEAKAQGLPVEAITDEWVATNYPKKANYGGYYY